MAQGKAESRLYRLAYQTQEAEEAPPFRPALLRVSPPHKRVRARAYIALRQLPGLTVGLLGSGPNHPNVR